MAIFGVWMWPKSVRECGADAVIEPYERIAQLLVMPYITADFCECDTLDETARGAGG